MRGPGGSLAVLILAAIALESFAPARAAEPEARPASGQQAGQAAGDGASEEMTVTGQDRQWLNEQAAHKKRYEELRKIFGPPDRQLSVRDRYIDNQNVMDPQTWEFRGRGVDITGAHMADKVLMNAVKGQSAW